MSAGESPLGQFLPRDIVGVERLDAAALSAQVRAPWIAQCSLGTEDTIPLLLFAVL
jgi:hypothetical protein